MADLIASLGANLTDPPHRVDPITLWGQLGYGITLAVGLALLIAAGIAWEHSDRGAATCWLAGTFAAVWAETGYLRAIHPDSTALFRGAVVAFIVVTLAAALLGRFLRPDASCVLSVATGGLTALLLSIAADHFYEYLASVPVALGTLVVAGVIAFVVTNDRLR